MMLFLRVLIVSIVGAEVALVLWALRGAGRRAGLDAAALRSVLVHVVGGMALWVALALALAGAGVLRQFAVKPPPLLLLVAGAVALLAWATTRPVATRLLRHTPRAWPVALQTLRVPIELMLFGLYTAGRMPLHLTLEGRNVDVLVGLSAPVVAWLVHSGRLGARALAVWNVASLACLANIVGMSITTMPGPLQRPWPGVSNVVVTEAPFVLLPALLVPVALFGHVLSLRQLRAEPTPGRASQAVATG